MDSTDVLSRLADEMPNFSKKQKRLAEYIYGNCDKAAFMTADMLADSAGVSESSVVRFSRQLSYEGYSELRRALQQVIRQRLSSADARADETAQDWLREAVMQEENSMQSIICDQNARSLEEAVGSIKSAGHTYVHGLGALSGLAQHISVLLGAMGFDVTWVSGNDAASELLKLCAGDVYIALCSALYSGSLSPLRYARDRNAATVLICDEELYSGNKYADCRIIARGSAAILGIARALTLALQSSADCSAEDGLKNLEVKRREYLSYEYTEN